MAESLIDFLDRVLQRRDRTGLRLVKAVNFRTRNVRAALVASFEELAPAHEELAPAVADEIAGKIAELEAQQPERTRLELRAAFDTAPTERIQVGEWLEED